MASKSSSFDIASTTDLAEVQNACNQTMLEIRQRFDFKGSKSQVELDTKKAEVTILADDGNKLNAVIDILQSKLIKRKVSIKAMDYGKIESATGYYHPAGDPSRQRKRNREVYKRTGVEKNTGPDNG